MRHTHTHIHTHTHTHTERERERERERYWEELARVSQYPLMSHYVPPPKSPQPPPDTTSLGTRPIYMGLCGTLVQPISDISLASGLNHMLFNSWQKVEEENMCL
jgi:hypothetical protein